METRYPWCNKLKEPLGERLDVQDTVEVEKWKTTTVVKGRL